MPNVGFRIINCLNYIFKYNKSNIVDICEMRALYVECKYDFVPLTRRSWKHLLGKFYRFKWATYRITLMIIERNLISRNPTSTAINICSRSKSNIIAMIAASDM